MATQSTVPPRTNGSLPRVDGPLKVSGAAKYSSDYNLPGMLYAVPVCATIASGKITKLDVSQRAGDAGREGGVSQRQFWEDLSDGAAVGVRGDSG